MPDKRTMHPVGTIHGGAVAVYVPVETLSTRQNRNCPPHDTVKVVRLAKRWHGFQHLHEDPTKEFFCPACGEVTDTQPILELPLFHMPCGTAYVLRDKRPKKAPVRSKKH